MWDEGGNRYLDATASLWCVNVGHGRTEIVDAAAAQMRELASYSAFGAFANRPRSTSPSALRAGADRRRRASSSARAAATRSTRRPSSRAATSPPSGSPTASTSSAAPRATTARTGWARASAASRPTARAWGRSTRTPRTFPHDSLEALEAELERVGPERVAAVFVEPVMGAGGVHQPRPGYVEGVAALCARAGALFVLDAVIAAFGRLGTWFAAERFGVRPDLLVLRQGRDAAATCRSAASRRRPRGRAVLGARRARCSATGRPTAPTPRAARRRWRTSTSSSTRACSTAGASSRTRSPARCGPLGDHELVGEVRAGIGALGRRRVRARGAGRAPRTSPPASSPTRATAGCSSARWATPSPSRRRSWSPASRSSTPPRSSARRSTWPSATCRRRARPGS